MPPTLLADHVATAWQNLTDEQKTCWNFWSLKHPLTTAKGQHIALYGYQAFYQINAPLAVVDPTLMLLDPPPNTAPPTTISIRANLWRKRSRGPSGGTLVRGAAWLTLSAPLPANIAAIIKQAYSKRSARSGRLPRNRHVTTVHPTESGDVNLLAPRGYYAETAGATRCATITGGSAVRNKHLPFCRVQFISLDSGQTLTRTVPNPAQ